MFLLSCITYRIYNFINMFTKLVMNRKYNPKNTILNLLIFFETRVNNNRNILFMLNKVC